MMLLSSHFTIQEFTASDTALRKGIDNHLPAALLDEARRTCEMLERIRARLSRLTGQPVPIVITSGYRCLQLNREIGSADTSDHVRALAVDFKAPRFGRAYEVARILAPMVTEVGIGQLIHEYGSWVHVSTREPAKQLNRIITISKRGTEVGVQEVVA
jgi:zinc D-Ala-D-Ala carboxypeptidase